MCERSVKYIVFAQSSDFSNSEVDNCSCIPKTNFGNDNWFRKNRSFTIPGKLFSTPKKGL